MKIHPTAIISPKADIDKGVEVGPYAIIEDRVKIKKGTKIGAHCLVTGWTTIGENNVIYTGAIIGSRSQDLKYRGEKSFLIIGKNNIFREYMTVNPGTEEGSKTVIGDNNTFMAYSHIAHDCTLGNNIIIANNGTLAGYVTVEDKAIMGGLVAIHQFGKVGTLSITGGCSKVVQDIPPYSTVDGRPARIFGINSLGLQRAGVEKQIQTDLKRAFRILFNSGLAMSNAIKRVESEIPKSKEMTHLIKFITQSKRGVCR